MKVGIVNDLPMAVEALKRALALRPDHEVIWVARDGAQAVERCAQATPDLVLMDLIMPVMDGVEATSRIMASTPCAILIVTVNVGINTAKVFEAMGHGALDVVDTPALRERGLSGRTALAADEGMLFLFDSPEIQSFWMKDMRFPIDIVWIRAGKIVGITPDVPVPASARELPQYHSPVPCDVVLELSAGAARRWGLQLGDAMRIER